MKGILDMFAGIDIGSVTTKAVLTDERDRVLAFCRIPTSYDREKSGEDCLQQALLQVNKSSPDVSYIMTTGYGRRSFSRANHSLPEIICHSQGTIALFPGTRTIIDIGGQDSKVIAIDNKGMVLKFGMNDKCAAGTGRFLEVLTERILNINLEDLGPLSLQAEQPSTLSSVCTVFAESEIVSLLSENKSKEDIAYGMHRAIAKRVVNMGLGAQIEYIEPIVFSGGVAKNIGVVQAIETVLEKQVLVPDEPQITAALGAAIFARERFDSEERPPLKTRM